MLRRVHWHASTYVYKKERRIVGNIQVKKPVILKPWTSYVLLRPANSLRLATSVVKSRMTSWKQISTPSFDDKISVSIKSVPSSIAL